MAESNMTVTLSAKDEVTPVIRSIRGELAELGSDPVFAELAEIRSPLSIRYGFALGVLNTVLLVAVIVLGLAK